MEVASFKISVQAFQVIMAGLGELPLKVSRPVADDLMAQAQALENAAAPAAPVAPAAPAAPAPEATADAPADSADQPV